MKRILTILSVCYLLVISIHADDTAANRPPAWGNPIKMDGVPNLHQVSTNLYRSAQPSARGMKNLKREGIKTIVNLRSFHSDRDEIGKTGLGYEHFYMKAWHPERKEIVRFLRIATNTKRTPVLVHCQHGADRTGTMCALYRIAVQGWTKEEAIREMIRGGFGFHEVWTNLPDWIEKLDIESIKKDAGITQDDAIGSLRTKYRALPKKQRRGFVKKLTADQMDQFIHETVQFIAKDKTPEQVSKDWERLTMFTGNRFEQWGEKLLAENRRLTRGRILELLRDPKQDFAWRVAFHGYLRVIFKNTEPRDAYEIGLTKDEVGKLKDEILKMQVSTPDKEPEATR